MPWPIFRVTRAESTSLRRDELPDFKQHQPSLSSRWSSFPSSFVSPYSLSFHLSFHHVLTLLLPPSSSDSQLSKQPQPPTSLLLSSHETTRPPPLLQPLALLLPSLSRPSTPSGTLPRTPKERTDPGWLTDLPTYPTRIDSGSRRLDRPNPR